MTVQPKTLCEVLQSLALTGFCVCNMLSQACLSHFIDKQGAKEEKCEPWPNEDLAFSCETYLLGSEDTDTQEPFAFYYYVDPPSPLFPCVWMEEIHVALEKPWE